MFDIAEVRNEQNDRMILYLNTSPIDIPALGECYAKITIGGVDYAIVGSPPSGEEQGDVDNRVWSLIQLKRVPIPNSFFERDNIPMVIDMITPFVDGEKLKKIAEILEAD